jgi:hypothetical protein
MLATTTLVRNRSTKSANDPLASLAVQGCVPSDSAEPVQPERLAATSAVSASFEISRSCSGVSCPPAARRPATDPTFGRAAAPGSRSCVFSEVQAHRGNRAARSHNCSAHLECKNPTGLLGDDTPTVCTFGDLLEDLK